MIPRRTRRKRIIKNTARGKRHLEHGTVKLLPLERNEKAAGNAVVLRKMNSRKNKSACNPDDRVERNKER